jgi:hypothetical protein
MAEPTPTRPLGRQFDYADTQMKCRMSSMPLDGPRRTGVHLHRRTPCSDQNAPRRCSLSSCGPLTDSPLRKCRRSPACDRPDRGHHHRQFHGGHAHHALVALPAAHWRRTWQPTMPTPSKTPLTARLQAARSVAPAQEEGRPVDCGPGHRAGPASLGLIGIQTSAHKMAE